MQLDISTYLNFKSARMKLAVLKAQNSRDSVYSQAKHDLDEAEQLEKHPRVVVMPKLNIDSEKKLLDTIHETFSQIFQALIVMLEDKSLFTVLPNEAEKISKRSKEFEVRLNRSVFEAKQQFVHFQAVLVKYSLKPLDFKRKSDLTQKFHAVLRCAHLILQSYLHHLPLSRGHVYPASLFKFTQMMQNFIKSGQNAIKEDLSVLKEDLERLENAARAFEKKFAESQPQKQTQPQKQPKKQPKKQTKKKLNVNMIDNLAREKFGSPRGDLKADSPLIEKKATESFDQVKSPLMDQHPDYFANISSEQKQIFHNLKESIRDISSQSEASKMASKIDNLSKINTLSKIESIPLKEESVSKANFIKKWRILEIGEDELLDIEEEKAKKRMKELKSWPRELLHLNPVNLVSAVADGVVKKVVEEICHEAVDPILIQRLIQAELMIAH